MNKKVIIGIVAAIVVLAGGLFLYNQQKAANEPLQFWWSGDGNETANMQAMLDDYYEETGVMIELVEVPYDDMITKLQTAINGGEVPALIRTTSVVNFKEFAVELPDVDPALYQEHHQANMTEEDGTVKAAPISSSANAVVYNKDLFEQYGVNVPTSPEDIWTWDEFQTEMDKLKGQEGVTYPGVYDFSPSRLATMTFAYGGGVISEDGTTAIFNSPETVAALTEFKEWHTEGYLDPTVWAGSGDANSAFASGTVGFQIGGSWLLGQDFPFEVGVTYLPTAPDGTRANYPGGAYIMAMDGSGHEQEAIDFINWFLEPEQFNRWLSENNLIDPQLESTVEYAADMQAYFDILNDEAAQVTGTMTAVSLHPDTEEIWAIVKQAGMDIVAGGDVQEVADAANAEIQTILDR